MNRLPTRLVIWKRNQSARIEIASESRADNSCYQREQQTTIVKLTAACWLIGALLVGLGGVFNAEFNDPFLLVIGGLVIGLGFGSLLGASLMQGKANSLPLSVQVSSAS